MNASGEITDRFCDILQEDRRSLVQVSSDLGKWMLASLLSVNLGGVAVLVQLAGHVLHAKLTAALFASGAFLAILGGFGA